MSQVKSKMTGDGAAVSINAKYQSKKRKKSVKRPNNPIMHPNVLPIGGRCNFSFTQPLIELDSCQLIELDPSNEESYCDLCVVNLTRQERVRTNYSCATCNVICCPDCYDSHHKEQMTRALRALRKNFPENLRIFLSEDAKLYTYTPTKDDSGASTYPSQGSKAEYEVSDLNAVLKLIKKQFNSKIEVNICGGNICIFFQDKQMEEFFNIYPEYLYVGMTCEIVDLELSLYLFICEDANGHCEIISGFLLKTADKHSITWMCEIFKRHNCCWNRIKIVSVDNEMQNTDVFKKLFPNAIVFFAWCNSMQKFKNDLNKLDISKTEKVNAIKAFENIFVACTQDEYYQLLKEFDKFSPALISYFQEKWHRKRDIWTLSLKLNSKIFSNPMSKFLYHIQRRMKGSLITQTKLEKVLKTFFITLLLIRIDHYRDLGSIFQTVKVTRNVKVPHHKYSKFLTSYGGKLVTQQLNASTNVKNIRKVSPGKYKIGSVANPICVTTSSCSCDFNTCLSLPCSHIFAIRKLLSLPLFWENLCAARWTAKFYQSTFLSLHASFSDRYLKCLGESIDEKNFKNYFEVVGQMLHSLSQCSSEVASRRLNVLAHVLEAWHHNIKVSVKLTTDGVNTKELKLDPNFSIDHLKNIYGVSADERLNSDEFSSVQLCSENSDDEILMCIKDRNLSQKRKD